jgi:hypothetical protein
MVLSPMTVAALVDRRRGSIATFEATIRGLDRSSTGALALRGPIYSSPAAERPARSREQRQRAVLLACGATVVLTLGGVLLSFSKGALAMHALSVQVLVAYAAGIVATARARR